MSRSEPRGGHAVIPISREEVLDKVRKGGVVLIDAQAPGWYEREHLPGALQADAGRVDDIAARLGDNPGAELVVYCWSETCDASARLSAELTRRGFANVRRYIGGKRDWMEAGLPVDSGAERPSHVHP